MIFNYIFHKVYVGTVGKITEALPYFSYNRISDTMTLIVDQMMLPSYCKRKYIPPLVHIVGAILIVPFLIIMMMYIFTMDIFGSVIDDYRNFKKNREKR